MHIFAKIVTASLFIITTISFTQATAAPLNMPLVDQANIFNLQHTEESVITGGQPTQEQITIIAKAGVKHIINLRPSTEQDWDEGTYVESLNMQYHNIPVAGIEGVTKENAESLAQLLRTIGNEPVLIHCSSGNRVGALIALGEHDIKGHDLETSIAEGRRWGLKGFEAEVRAKIGAE